MTAAVDGVVRSAESAEVTADVWLPMPRVALARSPRARVEMCALHSVTFARRSTREFFLIFRNPRLAALNCCGGIARNIGGVTELPRKCATGELKVTMMNRVHGSSRTDQSLLIRTLDLVQQRFVLTRESRGLATVQCTVAAVSSRRARRSRGPFPRTRAPATSWPPASAVEASVPSGPDAGR